MSDQTKKQLILATVGDLVTNFLYYDRKEDEELHPGDVEHAIATGEITLDEIVNHFRERLIQDGRLPDA